MDMHLELRGREDGTIGARIERALRDAIRDGRLKPEARLPSTRDLCVQLGVSRGVVAQAYAQLAAEGYLRTRQGAGTTVAAISTPAPRQGRSHARPVPRYDLSPFRPALDGFPRSAWVSALSRVCRRASDEQLGYPDPAGLRELREALASYLGRARGVLTTPRQVLVTSSLRQGLALVWSVLAAQGAARVAVESPGWRGMAETAADAGLTPVPVDVDDQGLHVASLADGAANAVAVAPAHQFPTGAVMTAARRAELVAWCARNDALIVEDDYDAEYRYDRRPVGALQGIAPERTVYGGSASKALAPSVRLGWLALPQRLVEPVAALQGLRGGMPAPLLQLALADLMQRGELDRHLRRQRRVHRRRRDALLRELASQLPELAVGGAAAGLFVVLWLPPGLSEQSVVRAARLRGLAPESAGAKRHGIVVGYANLSEAAVKPAVELLAQSVREAMENVSP